MSVIDVLGIITIAVIVYISFATSKSSPLFPSNFLLTSLLFYMVFPLTFRVLSAVVSKNLTPLVSCLVTVTPAYFFSSLFTKFVSSRCSLSSIPLCKVVPFAPTALGVLLGFAGGCFFVTSAILLSYTTSPAGVPAIIKKSWLYRVNQTSLHKSFKLEAQPKISNLPALEFLLNAENIRDFNLFEVDVLNMVKVISGVSNKSAKVIVELKRGKKLTDRELYDVLFTKYILEYENVENRNLVSRQVVGALRNKIKQEPEGTGTPKKVTLYPETSR